MSRGTNFLIFCKTPESHPLRTDSVPGSMVCSFMDEMEATISITRLICTNEKKRAFANP